LQAYNICNLYNEVKLKLNHPSNNQDYADKGSSSFGFGVGTSGVNASVGFGDNSFGLGAGSGGMFGSVVGNFNIGTSFKPGSNPLNGSSINHFSIFGGGYGLNGSLGMSTIANHSNLIDFGASYGLLGVGGTLQSGELLSVNGTIGLWSGTNSISDVDWTCFVAGTPQGFSMSQKKEKSLSTL
jgi:hypothetical protein